GHMVVDVAHEEVRAARSDETPPDRAGITELDHVASSEPDMTGRSAVVPRESDLVAKRSCGCASEPAARERTSRAITANDPVVEMHEVGGRSTCKWVRTTRVQPSPSDPADIPFTVRASPWEVGGPARSGT